MKKVVVANLIKYTVGLPLMILISFCGIFEFVLFRSIEFVWCCTLGRFDKQYPLVDFPSHWGAIKDVWKPHSIHDKKH